MMAIQQEPTPDISPETLGALSALMLAQAQEIFVHKAIHDSMKDGIVARLAAQAEELYADALKLFQKEIFRAFWDKEWVPLVSTSIGMTRIESLSHVIINKCYRRLRANKLVIAPWLNFINHLYARIINQLEKRLLDWR